MIYLVSLNFEYFFHIFIKATKVLFSIELVLSCPDNFILQNKTVD